MGRVGRVAERSKIVEKSRSLDKFIQRKLEDFAIGGMGWLKKREQKWWKEWEEWISFVHECTLAEQQPVRSAFVGSWW